MGLTEILGLFVLSVLSLILFRTDLTRFTFLRSNCESVTGRFGFLFHDVVAAEGLEPPSPSGRQILSMLCMPFHHAAILVIETGLDTRNPFASKGGPSLAELRIIPPLYLAGDIRFERITFGFKVQISAN